MGHSLALSNSIAETPVTYVVENVEISIQGVTSGHDCAIVRDLDGVVERVQVDAINY